MSTTVKAFTGSPGQPREGYTSGEAKAYAENKLDEV
jgi:hypothetical protein